MWKDTDSIRSFIRSFIHSSDSHRVTLDQTVKPTRDPEEEPDKTIIGQMVSVVFQRGKSNSCSCGGEGKVEGQRVIEDKRKAGRKGRAKPKGQEARFGGHISIWNEQMWSIGNCKAIRIIHSWPAEDTKRCLKDSSISRAEKHFSRAWWHTQFLPHTGNVAGQRGTQEAEVEG